jgi:PEP-CTERM motif
LIGELGRPENRHRHFQLEAVQPSGVFMSFVQFGRSLGMAALISFTPSFYAAAASVTGQGTWETTLQGRDLDGNSSNGFEAYYDTSLDITWLADVDYANTSRGLYPFDGMTWSEAKSWAAGLSLNGVDSWRLPKIVDTGPVGCDFNYAGTDCGYNVDTSKSELAHMFYVTLGNQGMYTTAGTLRVVFPPANTGPFSNLEALAFWSGTEHAAPYTNYAWYFGAYDGKQNKEYKDFVFNAWAVHDGDVGAVPEPSAWLLAMSGIVIAGLARRHRLRHLRG